MRKQAHLYYTGMVQGVGFRFTVKKIAAGFAIDGFVKNLPDGWVEVVAVGEAEEVKTFLKRIKGSMRRCIKDVEINWQAPTEEFSGFEIRF